MGLAYLNTKGVGKMNASRAILCGMVLGAISLAAPPCIAQDTAADKECIALINEYFAAVARQDIRRIAALTASGPAVSNATHNAAYVRVYEAALSGPVKIKLRKAQGTLRLYDVSAAWKGLAGVRSPDELFVLATVAGSRKIADILPPKEAGADLDPADFKNVPLPDLEEAFWCYRANMVEAKYARKIDDRASKPLPEENCLRTTYSTKIRDIDPALCRDTMSAAVQGRIFEGLYAYHYLKRPVEVISMLADGMPKVSDDGLVWTIKIKKGVKYSRNPCFGLDPAGKPKTRTVKAADFVLAFKRVADWHLKASLGLAFIQDNVAGVNEYRKKTRDYKPGDFSRYDKEELKGIVALDELTLRITLRKRTPQFVHILTMTQYAPFPREVIDCHLASYDDGSSRRKPIPITKRMARIHSPAEMVGTGPYIIAKHIYGERITFVRNPDFREQLYPSQGSAGDRAAGLLADAGKRLPFIDRIEMDFVSYPKLSWKAFGYGQTDQSTIHPDTFAEVVGPGRKLRKEYSSRGVKLVKAGYPAVYWIAINMKDPILGKSKSLRQAMSMAIDRKSYIETIFRGCGKPATNCLASSIPGWSEAGPGPYARFDLAAAKEKLIAARKELTAEGLLKSGRIPTLTLDLGGRDVLTATIAAFMQKQFAAIGLNVDIKLNTWPEQLKRTNDGAIQMVSLGWHADYPDPENFLQLYHSPQIKAGTNYTRYSNPAYDAIFEKFTATPYGPARDALCKKLVNMISEDCPVLLVYEPVVSSLHQKWLHNVKPAPHGYGTGRYLRIDAKARAAAPPAIDRSGT